MLGTSSDKIINDISSINVTSTLNGKIKVTKYLMLFGTIASSIHNFPSLTVGAVFLVIIIILLIIIMIIFVFILSCCIWMRKKSSKVAIEGIIILKIS